MDSEVTSSTVEDVTTQNMQGSPAEEEADLPSWPETLKDSGRQKRDWKEWAQQKPIYKGLYKPAVLCPPPTTAKYSKAWV